MLTLNYDKRNDVLYISMETPRPSYGDEVYPGVVVRKDFHTDEITGVTILGYKKMLAENKFDLNIPLGIDFKRDVIPFVN